MTQAPEQHRTEQQRWGLMINRPPDIGHHTKPWPPPPPPPPPPPSHQTRAMVVVRRIYCSCTTEQGHDEVYYLFGGVNGAGKEVSHRGPDPYQSADADNATAWDMNDGGAEQNRSLNATIYDEGLAPGQTATFACGFYESDSQDYGSTVAAAGKLAEGVGTVLKQPLAVAAGKVLEWVGSLIPKNQDDFLGAFSLRLANNGQVKLTEVAAGTYARVIRQDLAHNTFSLSLKHDDGDYVVDIQVAGR